jgi:MFS transporter, DHA2 family, multidrug resistance protein
MASEKAGAKLNWPGIAALSLGTSAIVIDGSIINVALPSIAKQLAITDSATVTLITMYQLVLVAMVLPLATYSERIGYRRLYQGGQALFILAAAAIWLADSFPALIVLRGVQALGAAAALSVTAASVRRLYPDHMMGRGLALNSLLISIAAACSPMLGGYVVQTLPWQACFSVAVPFLCLSIFLGRFLPEAEPQNFPFDLKAAFLCAATFALFVGGLEILVQKGTAVLGLCAVALGTISGMALFRRERIAARPMIPFDLFKNPFFARAVTASMGVFIAMTIMNIAIPFRLTHLHQLSPIGVGQLMAVWPLTMMIVSPMAGIISDKASPGSMGMAGMLCFIASMLALGSMPADASTLNIAWRFALGGLGLGLFLAPNSRIIVSSAPPDRAAAAGGSVSTARLTGQALGATVASLMLASNWGTSAIPMMVAAAFGTIALMMSGVQFFRTANETGANSSALAKEGEAI